MSKKLETSVSSGGMARREFILWTSACAAVTLAVGPKLFADVLPATPSGLAVGCAPIDEVDRARIDPFDVVLASASSLTSSDGTFLRRGARVRIAGIGSGSGVRRTTELRPHYLADGTNDMPVIAWGTGGGLVGFTMPIEVEQRLRFSLVSSAPPVVSRRRLVGQAASADSNREVVLSLLSEPDVVKLKRAYYVIVPLFDDAPEPKWGSYTLLRHQGHMLMHERRDGFMQPVECEHFVLRADYAIPGF
jgi:hypothetical protein